MNDKFCRICWNTNGWRKPSGAVPENENSFAGRNGFGMEEWLFNYEWLIDGEKYGYLTPISRFRPRYEGETFSALLYAKHEGLTLLVAEISDIYVPKLDELEKTIHLMTENGWIAQMREDIENINGTLDAVGENLYDPVWSINIRFNPNKVTFHDPMQIIDRNMPPRYHPYNWNKKPIPIVDDDAQTNEPDDPRRSELQRKRAAQCATTFDPKHVRLQNKLFSRLKARHGNDAVRYEQDHVDLKILSKDGYTLYEIKTDVTAKKCIRNAIGQLLEYSSYPAEQRANKLVVVGDTPAMENDQNYLKFLRQKYSLPIFYCQFNWNTGDIGPEL